MISNTTQEATFLISVASIFDFAEINSQGQLFQVNAFSLAD